MIPREGLDQSIGEQQAKHQQQIDWEFYPEQYIVER